MESRENVGKEAKKEVLIIIPAYNEEKTIVPLLEKLEQPEIAHNVINLIRKCMGTLATK